MPRSRNSIILLSVLLILVFFFGGFRLGAFVEHADKTYVPQPVPTTSPSPSVTKQAILPSPKKFTFVPCEASFFLPSDYVIHKESTDAATFSTKSTQISATCRTKKQIGSETSGTLQTSTLTLNGQKQTIYHLSPTTDVWEVKKPGTNQFLKFTNPSILTELIARTVVFEPLPSPLSITPNATP